MASWPKSLHKYFSDSARRVIKTKDRSYYDWRRKKNGIFVNVRAGERVGENSGKSIQHRETLEFCNLPLQDCFIHALWNYVVRKDLSFAIQARRSDASWEATWVSVDVSGGRKPDFETFLTCTNRKKNWSLSQPSVTENRLPKLRSVSENPAQSKSRTHTRPRGGRNKR